MKIYISGKITGLKDKEVKRNFSEAMYDLRSATIYEDHVCIVNPLYIRPFLGIRRWWAYMVKDLRELSTCTHIAMQSNWIDSRGAVIEYFFAKFIFKLEIIWL